MSLIQQIYDELLGRDYAPTLFADLPGLRHSGSHDMAATCPFCGKAKKFTFSLIKPIYNCWVCNATGSWVDYLINHKGMEFKDALKQLADAAGVELKKYDPEETKKRERRASVLEAAHQLYRRALIEREYESAKRVWTYLTDRGYTEDEIRGMELGCALPQRLTCGPLIDRGYTQAEITEAGLLTGGYGDIYTLSMLWTDSSGRALGLCIRSLKPQEELDKLDIPKYKYSRGSKQKSGLMGLPQVRNRSEVLLVEGVLDALYLNQHGIPTVATGGLHLAVEQAEILARARIKNLVVCLDSDDRGQNATDSLLRQLYAANALRPYVISLPEGSKDPDELVRDQGPDVLKRMMNSAISGGAWLGKRIGGNHDWNNSRDRDSGTDAIKMVLPLIADSGHQADFACFLEYAGGPKFTKREITAIARDSAGAGTDAGRKATGGSRGSGSKSRSGLNHYAQQLQDELGCNDSANARRLLKHHGADLRFVHDWKKWLYWNKDCGVWSVDITGYVNELAAGVGENIRKAALDEDDRDRQAWLLKHARSSLNNKGISDMLDRASTNQGVAVTTEDLDAQPHLFNVMNGTLELTPEALAREDGPLRPAERCDLLTQQAAVRFEPGAECPRFMAHLERIFADDAEMIQFMIRFLGHALLCGNPDQVLAIWYGEGANGKSTILGVCRHIFGSYASTLDTEVLMARSRGGNNQLYELATLRGVRLVTASETEQEDTLKAALTKSLTGGDEIRGREPYGSPFSFRPQFVPVMATNKKPRIMDSSYGMWRRVLLVPFTVQIPEADWISDYDMLLFQEEASGILNLLLDGLLDYLERRSEGKRGLGPPAAVQAATNKYREEQDLLAEFLKDCIEQKPVAEIDPQDRVSQPVMWQVYEGWCMENARDPVKKRTFNKALRQHFGDEARSNDVKYWPGVQLSRLGLQIELNKENYNQGRLGL